MAKWLTDPATGERVRFVPRKECGLPASRAPKGAWEREHAIAHHGVGRGNGVPLRECMAIWRGYWRYHVEDKGWNDIGYSSGWGDAPDVGGAVLEGRWWGNDGAHTQNGGNRLGYAGCYIGDGREAVADSAWRAWRAWLAEGIRVGAFPSDPELSDHNDWFRKVCAGPKIRSVLHAKSRFTRTPEPNLDDPEDDMIRIWHGRDTDDGSPQYWAVVLSRFEYRLLGDPKTIDTWTRRVESDGDPDVIGHSEAVDRARPSWFAGLDRAS